MQKTTIQAEQMKNEPIKMKKNGYETKLITGTGKN